eukprot:gb/GECG01014432.1/.p1 GENE.gb/GECG01014432.1/~~gb/GECG01014432.1/.p1  ORF type:complete len:123 (+),score=3.88 gb/GECG01014432.1/:1-369(+)
MLYKVTAYRAHATKRPITPKQNVVCAVLGWYQTVCKAAAYHMRGIKSQILLKQNAVQRCTCDVGTVPNRDQLHCVTCPPGTYSGTWYQNCIPCGPFELQPYWGQTECRAMHAQVPIRSVCVL